MGDGVMSTSLRTVIICLLGLAITLYFLQAFTPLRLTSDSIYYLSLADSVAAGNEFGDARMPVGYPVFAFLLIKAGIFSSATMVVANCLFFLLGLAFTFRTLVALGIERRAGILACLLTLLSFTAVKHVTQGMSDFLFFALSACACWLMTTGHPWKWAALVALVFCAIEVRFIGLALLFPIAVLVWPQMKKSPTVLIVGSTVLLTGLGSGILVGRHYLTDNLGLLENNGWARFLLNTVISHCRDFGELIVNAPLSKLPSWCQVPILVLGACSMLMFFVGVAVLWSRSRWLSAYLIGGCILVLPWPYTDPRFWLPILPFAFVAIFLGSLTIAKRGRLNLTAPLPWALAYSALFCCLGLASLGYSTWITFSGPQFPYRYGDGLLRSTYLTGCSLPGGHTNRSALHLLRQYEWHCRQAAGNASERAIASQF